MAAATGSSRRRASCSGRRGSATSRCRMSRGRRASPRRRCTTTSRTSPTCTRRSRSRGSQSIHEAMDVAANEGGTLEERLVRLAVVGFERLETDVYAPHLHAHEHLDDAHHQQLHKAMDELQEPVIRCFAEAGPADARAVAPKAASELLGGVLFSLIFAPGEGVTTARCPRTGSSGPRWRSGCSSAATGRSRGARTSRPEDAGCRIATATRPGSGVQARSAWSASSASSSAGT